MATVTLNFTVNPEFDPWLAAKVTYVMDASAEVYADEVRRLMATSSPSGRLYRRSGGGGAHRLGAPSGAAGGRVHRASAPGQPPAPDTEALVESIATSGLGEGFRRVIAVGVDSEETAAYAVPLELGTATILPRPAWLPSLLAVQGRLGSPE